MPFNFLINRIKTLAVDIEVQIKLLTKLLLI